MRRIIRLNSEAVQGPGTYVELRAPLWSEVRELFAAYGNVDEQDTGAAMKMMEHYIPLCVVGWNWTDDRGDPLPLPANPSQLSMSEILWLAPHISEMLTPPKA